MLALSTDSAKCGSEGYKLSRRKASITAAKVRVRATPTLLTKLLHAEVRR